MPSLEVRRRLPIGAELVGGRGVHFRVWAPRRRRVDVIVEGEDGRTEPLEAEDDGYFAGYVDGLRAGAVYRFRLDGSRPDVPDPASRFQPYGPHGPSMVVSPDRYEWRRRAGAGITLEGQVISEVHIGTFTPDGTWAAAAERLPLLAETGITCVELMPVAEFPGGFGWGYDGVNLFAPTRLYGAPDEFRAFVDAAHATGLAVILDVVFNHFGPDGNYLGEFSDHYFHRERATEWGDAINFDGPHSGPVREYFLANARYWIEEFRLDGFRFDATQSIHDRSDEHILAAVAREARAAAGGRAIVLIAENERQDTRLVRAPAAGGYGLDAIWNDDFHHSAIVALTGRKEAYYTDHLGTAQEFVSAAKYGFLYQGQYYAWQAQRRGTPALDLSPATFVTFLQNHDQVANSERGIRLHEQASPGAHRAMTALLLLMPCTPLLFQGQEFAASSPFLFFADHHPELAALVRKGRIEFLAQFRNLALEEVRSLLPDPGEARTFERCKLDWSERDRHAQAHALHADLLRLRREDPVFRAQPPVDGAVLSPEAFVLRYFRADEHRLVVVNFGRDMRLLPAPEPLLAPPLAQHWSVLWSSENPRYGGRGTPPLEAQDGWRLPGQSAVALAPVAEEMSDG